MNFRKSIAVLVTAGLFFWTPAIVPVKATLAGCGVGLELVPLDSAFAGMHIAPIPCPTPHGPSPAPVVAVFAGVLSVMFNAAFVWNTQCRELTQSEAMSSTFLPFLGIAFYKSDNTCRN